MAIRKDSFLWRDSNQVFEGILSANLLEDEPWTSKFDIEIWLAFVRVVQVGVLNLCPHVLTIDRQTHPAAITQMLQYGDFLMMFSTQKDFF